MKRSSGVLMHVSSLPNDLGIGSFGQEAYDFIDFLVQTKQTYWQVLPLTTTSYGDSPYQSFSAYAGNTHFIDLHTLVEAGYLEDEQLQQATFGADPTKVDYGQIFAARRPLLEAATKAFQAAGGMESVAFRTFLTENAAWLAPFARYMTVKEGFENKAWYEWSAAYRTYEEERVRTYCTKHQFRYDYHLVTQFFFDQQWQALKSYANENHIQIIGDIPIYVAQDSVEMWMFPHLFKVDADGRPTMVAGTPPDGFSDKGQYWGNPVYDWEAMAREHYDWWIGRIAHNFRLYDVLRIDHFKGFESYWEIPFGSPDPSYGHWEKGPGYALFETIKQELGPLAIIAEDLGFMNEDVVALREATGFPGMKILSFGFNGECDSLDLPHHYVKNSVAYVGTHDNETARGWYEDTATPRQREQMTHYLKADSNEAPAQVLNRGIAAAVSDLAVYTMQNLLNLDNDARMNEPATIGGNWQWRMTADQYRPELTTQLLDLTETYFRTNTALDESMRAHRTPAATTEETATASLVGSDD